MARYTQLRRRGAAISQGPAGGTPPDQPDPPSFYNAANQTDDEILMEWLTPAALPAGAATWDLRLGNDVDPPTTNDYPATGQSEVHTKIFTRGETAQYAVMRAWNAGHDAYTDSTVASQSPALPGQPEQPIDDGFFEEDPPGDGSLWESNIVTPAALPTGAATWDVESQKEAAAPAWVTSTNAGVDEVHTVNGVPTTSHILWRMKAWDGTHQLYTLSFETDLVAP